MRRKLLLVTGLFVVLLSYGQRGGDTLLLLENFKPAPNKEAYHFMAIRYHLTKKQDSVLIYHKNGVLHSREHWLSHKKNGRCEWFHENGELSHVGWYKRNKPVGEQAFYDVSGVLIYTDIYSDGHKKIGQYIFTESGKKVFTESTQLSSFGNYRNPNTAFKAMSRFISAELVKPEIVEHLAEPVVVVDFLISANGNLEEIEITYSADARLNPAVHDLMAKMPAWKPARFKGEPVYSQFSIAITF